MIYTQNGGLMFRPHVISKSQLFQSIQFGASPQTKKQPQRELKQYRSIQQKNFNNKNINSSIDKSISLISLKEESQLDEESFVYIQQLIYDDQTKMHNVNNFKRELRLQNSESSSQNLNTRQIMRRNPRPKTTTISKTFNTIASSVSKINIQKPTTGLMGFRVDGVGCGKTLQSRSDWFHTGIQQKPNNAIHQLSQNFIVRKHKPLKNSVSQFNL